MKKINITIEKLIAKWQKAIGDRAEVVLGGSLVSGLFIYEGARVVDVDVRFLVDDPTAPGIVEIIENITGLSFRKTIQVNDWPTGKSLGVMVEGIITVPECPLPLEVEGCIRNRAYVGWARFYREVLTLTELAEFRQAKLDLREDKRAYKALKAFWRQEVERRALAAGLVRLPPHSHSPNNLVRREALAS